MYAFNKKVGSICSAKMLFIFKARGIRSILRIGIKPPSLPVSWERFCEAPCAPHQTATGSPARGCKGIVHQQTRGFLLRVLWHFLVGVHPRVEPEVTALISDSRHSANTKEKQRDFHGYS